MLARNNRLGRSVALRQVLRKGRITAAGGFVLKTYRTQREHPRFAISISDKAEKRATRRNRMRRQLTGVIVETQRRMQRGVDCHVSVRKEAFSLSSQMRRATFLRLLKQARLVQ